MPTPYASTLQVDLAGDRDVWARQILKSQKKRKKHPPLQVNLEEAITGIKVKDTIVGASTIEVSILDPAWYLIDSKFFDHNPADGKLDPVEVNYPDGSRLWWRLTQMELTWGTDPELKLIFMERSAVYLMSHVGPTKASRGKKTRAEFIKSLTSKVKAGGGITFQSIALHKKQKLQHPDAPEASPDDGAKTGGVHRDDNLKVKGIDVVKEQIRKINLVNDVVFEENASERVALAVNCAAISESRYGMDLGSRGTTFQTHEFSEGEIKKQAYYFLHGGRSFAEPGAIGLAKAHRDWTPGEIAMVVEGSISNFGTRQAGIDFYNKYRSEAQAIVDAYGQLGPNSTEEVRRQYNFRVGDEDNPHETYWDAIIRLADEVKWAFFMDGNWAYFDTEKTLITQKPAAVIGRGNAAVVDFTCTLDNREIATEATLKLICEPFDFRAGEVIKLVDFGPASTISTATKNAGKAPAYPGRWLIQEIERDVFELVSSFTLKQPQRRLLEPDDQDPITVEWDSDSIGPDLLQWAKTQLGTTEGSQKQIDYAKALGYSASLPWCSIFVAYGLKRVEHKVQLPANPAYSGAWLEWEGGTKVNKSSMMAGDIVVFDWGDGGITDHVAIFDGKNSVIGGNQGNKVSKVPLNKSKIVGVVRVSKQS
jgi:uncharacterized protein (TIGR02594 family)